MNVPWTRITPYDFEKLALEYARSEYPQLKWVPTPRSGDGNRDAEAITSEWVLDRLIEYQHWLEAKFHHKKGAPARSQLDPTLVSGLIDPSVRAILFVTNGRISDSYMARAERAFSRPPDRFVAFREGPHLARWLSRHEAIARRYFGMSVDGAAVHLPELELSSASLLDISDYRRAFYKPVSHLVVGRDYLLHLVLRSTQARDLDLLLPESSPFIAAGPPEGRRVRVPAGTSSHCIRVTPRQIGVFDECPLALEESGVNTAAVTLKRLTVKGDPDLRIVFAAQAKVASDIKQLMRGLRKGSNAICCLYGKGGVGKTHVLDSLEADLDLQADFMRVAFSGQQGEDARLLCELLLFLHFGPAGLNLDAIDHSLIASSRQVVFFGQRLLDGLMRAASDAAEARALVRDLADNRDVRSADSLLVDPQPAATPVVVVADDVHKLRGSEASLLTRILTDHFKGSHNSLLLLSARPEEFRSPSLKTCIDESAIYLSEMRPPTAQEVAVSIDRLLDRPCPKGFSAALNATDYTTLNVVNLLVDLKLRGERVSEPAFAQTLEQWAGTLSLGKDKVVLERIATSRKLFPLLDVVHAVRIGVPLPPLLEKFGARAVDTAAGRGLLRLNADSSAVPFHDLVYDAYTEARGTCHTHEVGAFLAQCLDRGALPPDRALPALLRCGPSFECRYLDAALAYRDSFISVGRFGPALEVAKSIVTVFEGRRGQSPDDEQALAEAWFVYADCLDHCDTGDDTRHYFEKARGELASKWAEPAGNGLHFEAEAELFNLKFWDLEVNQIPALEDFVSRLKRAMAEQPQVLQERRFVRAYLTALNRLMTFSLLTDRSAEDLLQRNLQTAAELEMTSYHGFALADYAKGTYHLDPERALLHLRESNELFRRLGSERRRELTSATELAFLEARLGRGSAAAVSTAGRALLDEGLWPEYLNSRLKIVALLLARQDFEGASAQLAEFYRRRSTSSDDSRRSFLLANLEAGAAFLRGDYDAARDWTREHQKLVHELGASYRAVAEWNLATCEHRGRKAKGVEWYQSGVKRPAGVFLLEPRIW